MSEPVALPRHRGSVTMLTFTADGRVLSTSLDRTAQLMLAETRKPLAVFEGHLAAVADAAALANDRVVTASFDGGVRFFDATTGRLALLAKGHTSRVIALAVAPGRERVASVSDDGSVRIWDRDGNAGPVLRGHDDGAMRAYFEDDKAIVTVSRAGIVATWDATTGKRIETNRMATPEEKAEPAPPRALELAKGIVAEARDDGTVRITEANSGRAVTLGGHDDAVTVLAISPDGDLLAAGSADGAILVWRWREAWGRGDGAAAATPELPCVWRISAETKTPDTRFDGGELWVGRSNVLHAYDAETGERGRTIEAQGDLVHFGKKRLVFARFVAEMSVVDRKSGKAVLTAPLEGEHLRARAAQPLAWCTRRAGKPNALRIVDPDKPDLAELGPMKGSLGVFAFRADGKRAAVAAAEEPRAWLWNVESGKLVAEATWEGAPATQLAFTHDGTRVVAGTRDGRVHVLDATTGERVRELVPPPGDPQRQGLAPIHVSPASDRVVAWGGDANHAILFDTTTGAPLLRLFGEEKSGLVASGVAFSPDGTRLVAAHVARPKLVFYDPIAAVRVVSHEVHRSGGVGVQLRFFAGGKRMLSWATQAIDKSLRAWDPRTGERLWANLGLGGEGIDAVVLSPNERFLAVTSRGWPLVRVVDAATGKTVADLAGHQGYVPPPSFAADETLLATSSYEGDVQVWELPSG
ncbi:MAG: WD40 repeat domain-containing protein [Labilithrix sp.]|nr:WD40 repeat domain-containing protein [Labilithrix sp.]MCW5813436.1 WD40 repeat domain-containing protein [Labilithrix sp.]